MCSSFLTEQSIDVGSCPTTGLIGVSFGGGLGRLQGKYGLLHDSMISCRLVLADGSIINVSKESHPDLFWAIRGAGHNFGIAVEATFQVYPEAHGGVHYSWDLDFGLDQCDALFSKLNEVHEIMPPELAIFILWNRQNKSGLKVHYSPYVYSSEMRALTCPRILFLSTSSGQVRSRLLMSGSTSSKLWAQWKAVARSRLLGQSSPGQLTMARTNC